MTSVSTTSPTTSKDDLLPTVGYAGLCRCSGKTVRNVATVTILFYINLINYMDRYTVTAVIPLLKHYFNDVGDSQIGLLQTVFICVYMVAAPIFGYLGDRYSRKLLIVFGITCWSATVLGSTFVSGDQFWVFFACRGLVGIGEASYVTVAPTIIADIFSADMRSRMLMIFYFAIPVGSGLGYLVGGSVANAFGSWQWGLRMTPILGAIGVLLVFLFLQDPKRGEAEKAITDPKVHHLGGYIADLKSLSKSWTFIWATLGNVCVAFSVGSMSWWAPTYIGRAQRYLHDWDEQETEDQNGNITLIFGIVSILGGFAGVATGTLAAQLWKKRGNPRADPLICAIGIIIAAPLMYISLNISNVNDNLLMFSWVLLWATITTLSFNWAVVPDIIMYVTIPERRATANAINTLFQHLLGDAASPYIVGQVSEALTNGSTDPFVTYQSLLYAMYIPPFLAALGGFCFFFCSFHLVADKEACEKLSHGPIRETPSSQDILDPISSVSNTLSVADQSNGVIKVNVPVDTENFCELCDDASSQQHHF